MHLAFELSESKWKLGFSDGKKMRFRSIAARDLEQLGEEIEKAKERFGHGGKRMRRIGIVAVARRLLIDLWRYLQHGVIPEGARLRASI